MNFLISLIIMTMVQSSCYIGPSIDYNYKETDNNYEVYDTMLENSIMKEIKNINICLGEKLDLKELINDTNDILKYVSVDKKIVSISYKGIITGKKIGTTFILCISKTGGKNVYRVVVEKRTLVQAKQVKGEDGLSSDDKKEPVSEAYNKPWGIFKSLSSEKSIIKYWSDRNNLGGQDIAVYNGTLFGFDVGSMYVNGIRYPINNGHGNNCMFGTKIYDGDYPYLYCGSWNRNDCKIYVNKISANGAELIKVISYDSLKGYLNCCVDDVNNRIYILLNTSNTTPEGEVDFIISDFYGDIISRHSISKLPIIQGMTFHDGYIFVTSGLGSAEYPNKITVFDTSGEIVYENSDTGINVEFEGIDFDDDKIYIATREGIYSSS